MNVTKLRVIADEGAGNIEPGDVVAVRYTGDKEWADPHGGVFNEREQAQLNDLARGRSVEVRLDGVREQRVFMAHLGADFE